MGRGSSKAGGGRGLTASQENELEELGEKAIQEQLAKVRSIGGFTGKATAKERESAKIKAEQLFGSGIAFERKQYEAIKDVAKKNGIEKGFDFSDVRASVTRKTDNGYIEIKGDPFAFSTLKGAEKGNRWIVNTVKSAPYVMTSITEQKRFAKVEEALRYAKKRGVK